MNEKSIQAPQPPSTINTISFYLGIIALLVGMGAIVYWGFFKFLFAIVMGFSVVTLGTKFNSGAPWSLYAGHFRFALVILGGFVGIGSIASFAIGAIFFMIYLTSG